MWRKIRRVVVIVALVLLLLVVVGLCVFFFWLGPTVKTVAQKIGSKALGTTLAIDVLDIDPRHGTFHMTGFSIANPEGYGRTNAVALESMDIEIAVASLFSPTMIVHRVEINSPHFVYEQNGTTDNISAFLTNVVSFLGEPQAEPEPDPTDSPKPTGPSKTVIVEQLDINDIQFHLANTVESRMDIAVGLEKLSMSMTNGMVEIVGFHVTNPDPLETPDLFTLDRLSVSIDPAAFQAQPMAINSVDVIRPYAYLEHDGQTDTVEEFMLIAGSLTNGIFQPKEPAEVVVQDTTATTNLPVELRNLLIDDIQIKLVDASDSTNIQSRVLASIGTITAQPESGRIRISEIALQNPAGYKARDLFHLNGIEVAFQPESIPTGHFRIDRILIDAPTINLEQTTEGGNANDLLAELDPFIPSQEAAAPAPAALETEKPEPLPLDQQPVLVDALVVTNFAVYLDRPPVASTEDEALPADGEEPVTLDQLLTLGLWSKDTLELEEEPADEMPEGPLTLVGFDQLAIHPLKGLIEAANIRIANVEGFANPYLVVLDRLHVEIDPDTLQSDTLVIHDIRVEKPKITYERKLTTDNIRAFQEEIENTISSSGSDAEAATGTAAETTTEGGQKVVIDSLLIDSGKIRAKLSALPSLPSIPLPDIHLSDIGKESEGTSFGQAVGTITDVLYGSIIDSVSGVTKFSTDVLKGAGAITLGTLGLKMPGTEDPAIKGALAPADDEVIQEEPTAIPNVQDESPSENSRTFRSPLNRRRPGRIF